MVTTEYHGRAGNNLFQYVFARMLAEKNGLELATKWTGKLLTATPHKPGRSNADYAVTRIGSLYTGDRSYNAAFLRNDYREHRVHCAGFWQQPEYYWPHREQIREYFNEKFPCTEPDAIVMHMRFGDYWSGEVASVIHPSWHRQCLQMLKWRPRTRKVYIVCENPKEPFLVHYQQFQPIIVSKSPEEDFRLIASCGTVLCSNSSFSWWAAFLGHAKRVFTFGPHWMRFSPYVKLHETPTWEYVKGSFVGENYCKSRRRMGVPAIGVSDTAT